MIDTLVPFAALVRRELVRTLRQDKSGRIIVLTTALLSIAIVVSWPFDDDPVFRIHRATTQIARYWMIAVYFSAVAVLPALAATSVRSERDKDTLVLLLLTRISPRAMLAAHALNCMGYFLLYAIATLPLVCTAYLLTGFEWTVLPIQFFVLILTALTCIAAGLICTAFARSTPRAVSGAYILAAIMLGGYAPIASLLLQLIFVWILGYPAAPFQNLVPNVWSTPSGIVLYPNIISFNVSLPYVSSMTLQCAIVLAGFVIAWLGFRRLRNEKFIALPNVHGTATSRSTAGIRAAKPFSDAYNVVFQREFRVLLQTWRQSRVLRIGSLAIAGFMFVAVAATLVFKIDLLATASARNDLILMWIGGAAAVIGIVAPGVSPPLWIRERDMETREQLIMTLLRPRQIIFGKAFAASALSLLAACLWLSATSPVLVFFPSALWGWHIVYTAIPMLPLLALTLVAVGSQTPFLRVSSSMFAISLSYFLGIGYVLFPLVFADVVDAFMLPMRSANFWKSIVLGISPVGSWIASNSVGSYVSMRAFEGPMLRLTFYGCTSLFHCFVIYIFLRDSTRIEDSKVRKGSES
ncbi:MAG: ABC transporter permease [Candidatus Hydrogenedentes bacterium]|nr:ABC transporter permease [Candidatus Hydrogenedentota bacterium]